MTLQRMSQYNKKIYRSVLHSKIGKDRAVLLLDFSVFRVIYTVKPPQRLESEAVTVISDILWDWSGVFCPDLHRIWCENNAQAIQGIEESMREVMGRVDRGEISLDDAFEIFSREIVMTKEEIRIGHFQNVRINMELVALVEMLKRQYENSLLSNAPYGYVEGILADHGLGELFGIMVISAEVGLVKPQPEIFGLTLERLGVSAGRVLFIDDRQDNIDAASELGMATILYQGIEHLTEQLKTLSVI